MLTFIMYETEKSDVDNLTSRIKSKPELIKTLLIEIGREVLRSWAGVREACFIFYSQVV